MKNQLWIELICDADAHMAKLFKNAKLQRKDYTVERVIEIANE